MRCPPSTNDVQSIFACKIITRRTPSPCGWRRFPLGNWGGKKRSVGRLVYLRRANAPVLEATGNILEVSHASGSGRVSPLCLLSPLVCTINRISFLSLVLPLPPVVTHKNGAWLRGIHSWRSSCAACGRTCGHNDGTECASTESTNPSSAPCFPRSSLPSSI
jgi:hypothetical protein